MATKKKDKTGWKELPLIARYGLVGGGVFLAAWGAYGIYKRSSKEDRKRCAGVLTQIQKEYAKNLAAKLKYHMDVFLWSLPYGESERSKLWFEVAVLAESYPNVACYLHNYWIENIDPYESLYKWIDAEYTRGGSEEDIAQQDALVNLAAIGLL